MKQGEYPLFGRAWLRRKAGALACLLGFHAWFRTGREFVPGRPLVKWFACERCGARGKEVVHH